MFNYIKKKLIVNSIFKKKETVLIFGTGAGGLNAFNNIKTQYNIIYFLDNNIEKHGDLFCGKKILPPNELETLTFDKIIIASDYYKEIISQLNIQFGISNNLIEIFYNQIHVKKNVFEKIKSNCIEFFLFQIGVQSTRKANIIFSILRLTIPHFKKMELHDLVWLDNIKHNKLSLIPSKNIDIYSPQYINKKQSTTTIKAPEINAYLFQNAEIMTCINAVLLEENKCILARVPTANYKTADYSAGYIYYHGNTNAIIKPRSSLSISKGIAIIGSSDTNYYHWLLEVLSKLQFVEALPKIYDDFPILISEQALNIPSIKMFMLNTNLKRKIIYLNSTRSYKVNELVIFTPPNYLVPNLKANSKYNIKDNYIHKTSFDYLRYVGLKIKNSKSNKNYPQRVFLARKQFIRSYNQDEVEELLSQHNFESIYLEDLDFNDQIALMNNADTIVGPTGAAWTNLIFCKKKTKALCWMATEYGDLTCFSNLAALAEVDLSFITYDNGAMNSRETYYMPYKINIKKIKDWLRTDLQIDIL